MKSKFRAAAALPFLFLIMGAVMIAAGACGDAAKDIYSKAVRICLECIGIG